MRTSNEPSQGGGRLIVRFLAAMSFSLLAPPAMSHPGGGDEEGWALCNAQCRVDWENSELRTGYIQDHATSLLTMPIQVGVVEGARITWEVHEPLQTGDTMWICNDDSAPAACQNTLYTRSDAAAHAELVGSPEDFWLRLPGFEHRLGSPAPPGCRVAQPRRVSVRLDGAVIDLGRDASAELTRHGVAEDGRSIVLDAVDRRQGELIVLHQGAHARNAAYSPAPVVSFVPQPVELVSGLTRSGWAVLRFGASGLPGDSELLPADGGVVTASLGYGIVRGLVASFPDARRHDFNVYMPYEVSGGEVRLLGPGLVTLPMCCGRPCPPAPRECQ